MSNRILREAITTSGRINRLSPTGENFYYRLLVVADDFGLMDARLEILKARCYPLKKTMTEESLEPLIHELEDANLIALYSVGNKPFLAIRKWDQHQRIRAKRAKYPTPPSDFNNLREKEPENPPIRGHVTATGGHLPLARAPVTPAESELESESESESKGVPGSSDKSSPPRGRKPVERKPVPEGVKIQAATPPAGMLVWEAYRSGYIERYGTEPVRNALVNTQILHIIKRLGAEAAPEVAAFYVRSANPFYVKRGHALATLLSDCEKIHTEWKTKKVHPDGAKTGLSETRAATIAGLTGPTNPRLPDS